MGKIKILSTPSGDILSSLIKSGVQVGISSRGLGSVKEEGGQTIVEDDFGTKIKVRENSILKGDQAIKVQEKIIQIQDILVDEPSDHVKLYLKSVIGDIKRGSFDIIEYSDGDIIEDFSNYIADKLSA